MDRSGIFGTSRSIMTDVYLSIILISIDNATAGTRLTNNITFAKIVSEKELMLQWKDNAKEL